MKNLINDNPVTAFLLGITALVALGGLVVCIVNPDTLTFNQLLDRLEQFVIALGILGVGRGILAGAKQSSASDVMRDPVDDGLDNEERDLHEGGLT